MKASQNEKKGFFQPAFVICLVVLMVTAGATIRFDVIKKESLPLIHSLEHLDAGGLGSYQVLLKQKIENKEIVESLGTEDYIQWQIEDAEAEDESVRRFLLFITYYGRPDRVPHVPEECYTGGGYEKQSSDDITYEVQAGDFSRTVPGKYLVFSSMQNTNAFHIRTKFPVLYFFRVNDKYAGDRGDARMKLNMSLFQKYAYFSKVEMVFNQSRVAPTQEQAVAAATKLLSVILPALERNHWPDWKTAVSQK